MTLVYSNAVLTMLTSNATDMAQKLDLPVMTPIEPAHVRRFLCAPMKDVIGGKIWLTNGYQFSCENWSFPNGNKGSFQDMESPQCYYGLQDPDEIPRFYGTRRISPQEAVEIARQAIRKLGYNPPWLDTEQPKVEIPGTARQDRPKVVPRCRITWDRKEDDGYNILHTTAELEINTDNKRVEMYHLSGNEFWRKSDIQQPPVIPETVDNTRATPTGSGVRNTRLPKSQEQVALKIACEKATEISQKLGLAIKTPILPNEVDEYDIGFTPSGDLHAQIILAKGFRFLYRNGHIVTACVPDCTSNYALQGLWSNMPPVDPKKFYGDIRYTEEQVVNYATAQVRKLGYPDKDVFLDQKANVAGGPGRGNPSKYARYEIWWQSASGRPRGEPGAQFIGVEIDATTLQLKMLGLRSDAINQPSPLKPDKDQIAAPNPPNPVKLSKEEQSQRVIQAIKQMPPPEPQKVK